ncbi:MAG TPA: hypothetical protein VGW09_09650, partial [Nitrososphaeraceae archaeon]|nr:hypothetical protein [Nitrososphaeraceae archaeon]
WKIRRIRTIHLTLILTSLTRPLHSLAALYNDRLLDVMRKILDHVWNSVSLMVFSLAVDFILSIIS